MTRDLSLQALALARRAIELDPNYALALSYIARWLSRSRFSGWMSDEASEVVEGVRAAHRAAELEPNDPSVLANAAFGLATLNGDTATAIPWLDRSITLNPNSTVALGLGAFARFLRRAGQVTLQIGRERDARHRCSSSQHREPIEAGANPNISSSLLE